MKFEKSQETLTRALKSVPLGSQTFSKSFQQLPEGHTPLFLDRGNGGRAWDIDGNEYVDMICGLLPVVLGYRDPDVDNAIKAQLEKGISFSLATELEYTVAEKLIEIIPCAEMVRYGKNGTDATSAAIRLARAHTNKDHIIAIGYHGWQDWYIGATVRNLGIPEAVRGLTHKLMYNDLDAIEEVFKNHKDNVAAIIMEPMNVVEPAPGYLQTVKDIAHKNGAILIYDEVITGFRFSNGGAQEYFGVTPDLACFGKAMGNGMPISAITGRADIMNLMNEIFYSSTFAGEALSLAAANAVIDKFRVQPVIETIDKTGTKLTKAVEQKAKDFGLDNVFKLSGHPSWKIFQFFDHKNGSKEAIKTLMAKELISHGVLATVSHNICFAHNDEDIEQILKAYDHAFEVVEKALEKPALDERINMNLIRPVFAVRQAA